jgi:nitroreductase
MELFDAIAERHSYRASFRNQAIPREDLKRIVQAGLAAPSGNNAQTTLFVIIDEAEVVRQIGAMHEENAAVQQARAFIACIIDTDPRPFRKKHSFQVEDCAAAVENMLLAITGLGYASVWIDGWLREEGRAAKIGQMIGLPAGKMVRVLLPIGVPAEVYKRPEKKPFAERAWFNRYGQTR